MSAISDIEAAMAKFEGFGSPGTLATRNNNPGNLMYSPWEANYGAVKSSSGFASFPDIASGYSAFDQRVKEIVSGGASLTDLINTWSPAGGKGNSQASTDNYISSVAKAAGIDPNTPLAGAGGSPGTATSDCPWWKWNCTGCAWWDIACATKKVTVPDPIKSAKDSVTSSITQFEKWVGDTFAANRVAAVIVALILIAGGIYLFKPVQDTVKSVGKHAALLAAV